MREKQNERPIPGLQGHEQGQFLEPHCRGQGRLRPRPGKVHGYYAALDAYDVQEDLEPLEDFFRQMVEETWKIQLWQVEKES